MAQNYRPKLNPILHNLSKSVSGEDKRPNHFKFMTAGELAKAEWSGVRENPLTKDIEYWVLGEIKARVTAEQAAADPGILEKAHRELFGMR